MTSQQNAIQATAAVRAYQTEENPVTPSDTIASAATIATTPHFWAGMSGEQVTGTEAASHLDATAEILTRDGWTRQRKDDSLELAEDDESLTVTDMLRSLLRVARHLVSDSNNKHRTLDGALHAVISEGAGDSDTWRVARSCIEAVLRARCATPFADSTAWASKLGRTADGVHELLAEAAAFARQYGPAEASQKTAA